MKIYVLTEGSYSDYRIIAATTDKDKANKLKELYLKRYPRMCKYDIRVEEYDDGEPNKAELLYFVTIKNGSAFTSVGHMTKEGMKKRNIVEEDGSNCFMVKVMAESESQAIKIAQDLIAQHKAEKEGIL